jgi:cyanophycinase
MTKGKEASAPSRLPAPKGRLLAIGGKESKRGDGGGKTDEQEANINFISEQILRRFAGELKGKDPLVAIIPTASTVPEEIARDYVGVFRRLGVGNIEVINITDRQGGEEAAHLETVSRAAGVMFTGGDQLRLTSLLGGTPFLQRLKERYTHSPLLVAGTSAGATAMSTPMIYEGESQGGIIKGDVRVATGLEFLKNVAIDTHFIARGRIVRMAQCLAANPGCIGIGLEEDTAVLVTGGREVEVIGSGLVTVVDGTRIASTDIYEIENGEPFSISGLQVHLLANGKRYRLPTYPELHT